MDNPLTVAILEDHLVVREALANILSAAGIQVLASEEDADAFVRTIFQTRPTVAIVDLSLDHGDGLEAIGAIRRQCSEVPVLVLSGSREPGVIERCIELGVAGYLDKLSAGEQVIVDAVRSVARGGGTFPSRSIEDMLASRARPPEEHEALRGLTTREKEVLALIADGRDNLQIAAVLGITERTVKSHIGHLYRKLGQENRTQMAILAMNLGIKAHRSIAAR